MEKEKVIKFLFLMLGFGIGFFSSGLISSLLFNSKPLFNTSIAFLIILLLLSIKARKYW